MSRNTGWDDPLGGIELPYDGRSVWGNGNSGGSSSGGSGGSSGSGCGCGPLTWLAGATFLAALGGVLFLLVMLFR